MRSLVLVILVGAIVFIAGGILQPVHAPPACTEPVEAVFSPGLDAKLLALLESANESIDVEVFQFSYEPFKEELVEANERGVRVRVILEPRLEGDDNVETAEFLARHGVEVRWASLSFARTHSKFAVIDGKKVFVGSPNWSRSAMLKNREAAVITWGGSAVKEFVDIFAEDWRMASPAN